MSIPRTQPQQDSPAAALAEALERVGDRWTLQIVDALLRGPHRFGDLAEAVGGIAPNILTSRLRRLEQDGIVVGRPYSRRPLRLTYELTALGRELAGAVRLLAHWGAGHASDADVLRHETCGTPLEPRWYCPTCARPVDETSEEELRHI
jgi:DNA-binding HxlR family transcriptional regulator